MPTAPAPGPWARRSVPAARTVVPGPCSGVPVESSSSLVRSRHRRFPSAQQIRAAFHRPCRDHDPAPAPGPGSCPGPDPRGWRRHGGGGPRGVNGWDGRRARLHCAAALRPRPRAAPRRVEAHRVAAVRHAAPRRAAARCAAARGWSHHVRGPRGGAHCVYPHGARRSDHRKVRGPRRRGDAHCDHGRHDDRGHRGAVHCGRCARWPNPRPLPGSTRCWRRSASGSPRSQRQTRRAVQRRALAQRVPVRQPRRRERPWVARMSPQPALPPPACHDRALGLPPPAPPASGS